MMERNIYARALEMVSEGGQAAIRTEFSGKEGRLDSSLQRTLTEAEVSKDERGISRSAVTCRESEGRTVVMEPVFPRERLIILGGGHVGLALCEMAVMCDFHTIVCDDRPEFAGRERFPGAGEVLCDAFTVCLERLKITPRDYVVIVTRGHIHDGECLRKVLSGTQPAYTGMIGSRKRVGEQLAALLQEGFSRERIERVCTPIGLRIGAVTPREIAVSILAQMISYRRLPEYAQGRPWVETDLTWDMIRYLAQDPTSKKAVATVIGTTGSAPGGAGAKMAVLPDGQIVGTIGGGWGESVIIKEAVKLIGTGTYRVCTIEMNKDVSAKEGMACGGSMQVLIEDASDFRASPR